MEKSNEFFFGAALIMILVAVILTTGQAFQRKTIKFGSCELTTEIASTKQDKARGLSNRPSLDEARSMIFPFNNEQPVFWMKDMHFPIDIIWINDTKVVQINSNLQPDNGETTYIPAQPIDYVIEVNSGKTARCAVVPGTVIQGLHA